MLGIQTRLRVDPGQADLLDELMATFSIWSRRAYQRVSCGKLEPDKVYAFLSQSRQFTAHQSKSIASMVEQWRASDQAILQYRIEQSKLRIDGLTRAVEEIDSSLAGTGNAHSKKWFLRPDRVLGLKSARFQKNRALANRKTKLFALEEQLKSGSIPRVFGSRKLLIQRQQLTQRHSPWENGDAWRSEWDRKRSASVCWMGDASHTGGNQSAQVSFDDKGQATLAIRLTESQAEARLSERVQKTGVPLAKLPNKMECKRLSLAVSFEAREQGKLRQAQCLGLPITVFLQRKPVPGAKSTSKKTQYSRRPGKRSNKRGTLSVGGSSLINRPLKQSQAVKKACAIKTGYYVHLSFDLPRPELITSRHQGSLGVDVNAWGLAYSACGPDGNLLKNSHGQPIRGDLPLTMTGLTANQAKAKVREAVKQLVDIAVEHKLALGHEHLDFKKKKSRLREMPAGYSRMLSGLRTASFEANLSSRCHKQGVPVHRVNPAWTSVAGYAKYGSCLSLSVDQAASYAIARATTLGRLPATKAPPAYSVTGKKLSPKYVRQLVARQDNKVIRYQESTRLAKPFPAHHQRMVCGQTGFTWPVVAKILGRRSQWANTWTKAASPARLNPAQSQDRLFLAIGQEEVCGKVSAGLLAPCGHKEYGERIVNASTG